MPFFRALLDACDVCAVSGGKVEMTTEFPNFLDATNAMVAALPRGRRGSAALPLNSVPTAAG